MEANGPYDSLNAHRATNAVDQDLEGEEIYLTQNELQLITKRFLTDQFSQCTFRDKKQVLNAMFLTVVLIATISMTLFSTVDRICITTAISIQICLAVALLVTVCFMRKMLGFFLSYIVFAAPFFTMLMKGSLIGEKYDDLSMKEQRLVVWEWLLFPVGSSLYFFAFLAYQIFRRYRRTNNHQTAQQYRPEYFESNRSLFEFLCDYKTKKTKLIEADLIVKE